MSLWEAVLQCLKETAPDCGVKEYDCGDGAVLRRYDGVPAFEEARLRSVLSENGFALREEVCIDDNRADTFFDKEGRMAQAYYCPRERCLRLVADPSAADFPRGTPEPTPALCPVRLWQFEVDHSLIDCGMCYIFQLTDGSYFIIDSGHHFSVNDDVRISAFLRQHAVGQAETVRVRGWYFSHCHSDHVCKFLDVLQFHPEIEIDAIYCNFVSDSHPAVGSWDVSEWAFQRKFRTVVADSRIPVCKLHSFRQLRLPGICFTVLCTHEDVFPSFPKDFNNTSTVLMAQIGGDKVCFPGDACDEVSPILEQRFPSFLSCDVLQQAHHAHFGLSPAFYRMAGARVLLSPTTRIKYDEEYEHFPANPVAASVARHVFVASDGTVELTFPLRDNAIRRYPDETFENFDGIRQLWNYSYDETYRASLFQSFLARQTVQEFDFGE